MIVNVSSLRIMGIAYTASEWQNLYSILAITIAINIFIAVAVDVGHALHTYDTALHNNCVVFLGAGVLKLLDAYFLCFRQTRSFINAAPDAAHFCNRAIGGSLQLIDVMVELVRPQAEIRLVYLDCQLYFYEQFPVQ